MKKRHLMGCLRVVLALLLLTGSGAYFSGRAVLARVEDRMLDFGRHLITLSEGTDLGERKILVNGQTLGFTAFHSSHNTETAMDFYEQWCRDGTLAPVAIEDALFFVEQSDSLSPTNWRDLVVREWDGETGIVACMKATSPRHSTEQLLSQVGRFAETGNLNELGQFHYAAVTPVEEGIRVVAVWTEDTFNPLAMFPAQGDAPGFDSALLPRPPSGRRMLSAGELGHPQNLNVYIECEEELAELVQFYRDHFARRAIEPLMDRAALNSHLFVVEVAATLLVISINREPGELVSVSIATDAEEHLVY